MRLQLSKHELKEKNVVEFPEYKPGLGKFLNFIAIVMVFILILVIYLPTLIWQEEENIQQLGREKMTILNKVEDYYNKMAGEYQEDPIIALKVIEALRDSTRADSNFYGKKVVNLDGKGYEFDVIKNFYLSFDTTFAKSYQKRDTVEDITVKVLKWNSTLRLSDTLYVPNEHLAKLDVDTILGRDTTDRIATETFYLPYYLTDDLVYRPLTNEKYKVLSNEDTPIKIYDPIDFMYKDSRFVFFTLKDTSHGYIENGDVSW